MSSKVFFTEIAIYLLTKGTHDDIISYVSQRGTPQTWHFRYMHH